MTIDNELKLGAEAKLYYKIGEVSRITNLNSSVLRFWETEFKNINPKRTQSHQRLYSQKDLDLILKIKDLLYNKKFTIEGAKKYLTNSKDKSSLNSFLYEIKKDLHNIQNLFNETFE